MDLFIITIEGSIRPIKNSPNRPGSVPKRVFRPNARRLKRRPFKRSWTVRCVKMRSASRGPAVSSSSLYEGNFDPPEMHEMNMNMKQLWGLEVAGSGRS